MVTLATAHGFTAFSCLITVSTLRKPSPCSAISTEDSPYLFREKTAPWRALPTYSESGSDPRAVGQQGNSDGVFQVRCRAMGVSEGISRTSRGIGGPDCRMPYTRL